MKRIHVLSVGLLASVAALAFFFCGCEDNASTTTGGSFSLSPDAITMSSSNNAVAIMAVGGHLPFTWSVSDSSLGRVSGSGQTVTYTRVSSNGVNVVTATDNLGWTASSVISQH